jgi:hypothetical protein
MKRFGKWWKLLGTAAVVLCLASASSASAGPNTGKLSLNGGFDFVTAYFFRGILQERTGLIWEPYLTLNANLYSVDDYDLHRDGPVSSVGLFAGT